LAKARRDRPIYRQIGNDFWESPAWTSFPADAHDARLLVLWLTTGPVQRAVPGVLRVAAGGISDALRWSADRATSAMKQLEEAGVAFFDQSAQLAWFPRKLKDEPPPNPDAVRGSTWRAVFECWPQGDLAVRVRRELRAWMQEAGPAFVAAFDSLPGTVVPTVPGEAGGTVPGTVVPTVPGEVGGHQGAVISDQGAVSNEHQEPMSPDAGAPSTSPSASTQDSSKPEEPKAESDGQLFALAPAPVKSRDAARRGGADPSTAQKLERQQLREFWDEGVKNRGGTPLEWGVERGKRHKLVIDLLRLAGGIDGAKAHLGRVFARYDADDFWRRKGLSLQAAASAACIEELQTAIVKVVRGAGMKTSAYWRPGSLIPAERRSAHIAESLEDARARGDAKEIERLEATLRAVVDAEAIEGGRSPLTREQQIANQNRHADELRRSIAADEKELALANPNVVTKVAKFKRLTETVQQRRALVAEIERGLALLQSPSARSDAAGAIIHISPESKAEALVPGRKFL
jgi:hypothetical protein